jgi:hypothetical protein
MITAAATDEINKVFMTAVISAVSLNPKSVPINI